MHSLLEAYKGAKIHTQDSTFNHSSAEFRKLRLDCVEQNVFFMCVLCVCVVCGVLCVCVVCVCLCLSLFIPQFREGEELAKWEAVGPELCSKNWGERGEWNWISVVIDGGAGPQVPERSQESDRKLQMFIKYISPYFQ